MRFDLIETNGAGEMLKRLNALPPSTRVVSIDTRAHQFLAWVEHAEAAPGPTPEAPAPIADASEPKSKRQTKGK